MPLRRARSRLLGKGKAPDDHLGLMDHLGIQRFMVLGFCIGGPFIWNLVKRAPDRIIAAVVSQPVGFRKGMPNHAHDSHMKSWAPELTKQRFDITMEMVDRFLKSMYGGSRADFVPAGASAGDGLTSTGRS